MGYIANEVNEAILNNHLKSYMLPLDYVSGLRTRIMITIKSRRPRPL